jgi:hypothetical protein
LNHESDDHHDKCDECCYYDDLNHDIDNHHDSDIVLNSDKYRGSKSIVGNSDDKTGITEN